MEQCQFFGHIKPRTPCPTPTCQFLLFSKGFVVSPQPPPSPLSQNSHSNPALLLPRPTTTTTSFLSTAFSPSLSLPHHDHQHPSLRTTLSPSYLSPDSHACRLVERCLEKEYNAVRLEGTWHLPPGETLPITITLMAPPSG